ncbi:extracellular solute-binding protein [Antribacter sp. KLBMP9083]|uniref:Extracellular solute-binding protein n=1 Tax=Antribacter soli TaxID=2910976 RepID=A0AA41Q9R6_9MICO|nr:extracellular solute-binding protein [Antribacter soli]MCF4119470.1 extracellular solute-binding protein [Antribacter soli]
MRTTSTRARRAAAAAGVTVAALALAACAGGDSGLGPGTEESSAPPTEECPCEIRFSWWGSDSRHTATQAIIDAFEAENPDITVVPDFTDWGGYWDKLATSVAAADAPDVITQEERYISDYASRGVLADLSGLDIDTSTIDESILAAGQTADGQFGIPTGVNAYAVVVDPQIFSEAGVELPDDETWTWDDYVEIANEISAKAPEGVYGTQDYGFNEAGLNVIARQRGESLYTEDGELGVSAETVADFFQVSLDLQAGGGEPDAARTMEVQDAGPEGSLLGTNTGAMGIWWSNQLGALTKASGRELQLLRLPGESDGERTGMYLKPAMFYSVSATSEYPQASAKFVDYLLNSPEAAKIMLTDRGLPANTEIREGILGDLDAPNTLVADFMAEIAGDVVDSPPVPPNGSGDVAEITERLNTEVLFQRLTPDQAAEQFLTEVEAAIG